MKRVLSPQLMLRHFYAYSGVFLIAINACVLHVLFQQHSPKWEWAIYPIAVSFTFSIELFARDLFSLYKGVHR